jgi:hypothetical protein
VWGYPASYLLSSAVSAISLPFLARARRLEPPAGPDEGPPAAEPAPEVSRQPAAGRVEYPT